MSQHTLAPDKEAQLAARMARLGVTEDDLEETFVHSGGHGGQNVNKTSTCVMLLHKPTGTQVKCQETRMQGLNRYIARKLLLDKLEQSRRDKTAAMKAERAKARRRNRPRSYAAKQRMLADKNRNSFKKALRRPPSD